MNNLKNGKDYDTHHSKEVLMGDNYNNLHLKIADFKIRISALMTGVSFVLCMLFFLPLVSIKNYGSISGYELATEIKDLGQKGEPSNFIFLIIPAVLFIMFAVKNFRGSMKENDKSYYVSVAISVLAIIIYQLWRSFINSGTSGMGNVTTWFYVAMLGYMIMTVIPIWCIHRVLRMKKHKDNQLRGSV